MITHDFILEVLQENKKLRDIVVVLTKVILQNQERFKEVVIPFSNAEEAREFVKILMSAKIYNIKVQYPRSLSFHHDVVLVKV